MYNDSMNNYFEKSEQIGDQIYAYRGFLSQKEVEEYLKLIESFPKEDWLDGEQFQKPGTETIGNNIFGNVLKKIQNEIVPEGLFLENTPSVTKIQDGNGMQEHSDDCPHCKKINDPSLDMPDHLMKRCVLYGMVVYFSKFTGGQIYYPEQDVMFTPEPGDLIIHSTNKYCKHGVKPVIDGIRYSMAPYIVEYVNESDKKAAEKFWAEYDPPAI